MRVSFARNPTLCAYPLRFPDLTARRIFFCRCDRGVGGGQPNDKWGDVCCRTANQCETDVDCGVHDDPYKVPLCCKYCMEVYAESCLSVHPVNAGFMSVGNL